jgi:glycosyltransferase involved in cell wall biosynthesis
MILGRGADDEALGPAGVITWVGNARQTAEGILKIYRDRELRERMSQAAKERVRRYYDQTQLLQTYHQIYQQAAAQSGRQRLKARVEV